MPLCLFVILPTEFDDAKIPVAVSTIVDSFCRRREGTRRLIPVATIRRLYPVGKAGSRRLGGLQFCEILVGKKFAVNFSGRKVLNV